MKIFSQKNIFNSGKIMNRYFTFAAAAVLGLNIAHAQEIATWAGFRSAVATFTFDDNLPNQLTIAVPIFDKYGYKASFYIVNNWNPNYDKYKELVERGYEVGSHSDSHASQMPDSEIASSQKTIDSRIPNQTCNTITYPNCNAPSESLVSQNYIGGRVCSGQIDGKTPQNYNRISSIICGNAGSVNSAQAFQQKMREAIAKNGWVTFLIHEVDEGSGYSPTNSTAVDGALGWAKQNDEKIWVTTFRNAIMYSKERDAAKIVKVRGDAQSETYRLTHELSTALSNFDYPLSIRVKNANGWAAVKATQKGKTIEARIQGDSIYFDAVPNGGDIVLSNTEAFEEKSSSSGVSPGSSSSSKTTAFLGEIEIPGKVEAENYDINAFDDADGKNDSTNYRTDDAGIVKTANGYALGYTTAGDFFEYTLHVKTSGKYKVTVRGATGNAESATVTLAVGKNSLQAKIPGLGDWATYSETLAGEISLEAGTQTLRLSIVDSYVNIDWMEFSPAETEKIVPNFRLDLNSGTFHCQVFDFNGQLVKSEKLRAESPTVLWEKAKSGLRAGTYILRIQSDGQRNFRTLRVRK